MERLSDYDLAICFYLLQGKSLCINYNGDEILKEDLDLYFDRIENTLLDPEQSEKLFHKNVLNTIYRVSVLSFKRILLKDYLEKYCLELVNDTLKGSKNVLKWTVARQKFITRLAESNYNLNDYHTSSIKDIHLIAPDLIRLDYDIELRIAEDIEPLYIREGEDEFVGDNLDNFYKNFSFKCSLDLSSVVADINTSKKDYRKEVAKKPTLQDLMLEEIDGLVKKRGKGKEVTLKELIEIYNNITHERKHSKSNNISKQMKNYVSAYRKIKATTLTLGRLNSIGYEYYFIEQIQP